MNVRVLMVFLCLILDPAFSMSGQEESKEIRIVSLSPAITETLFDLGAEELIVGTVENSNFPEAAKTIQRVGSYQKPSIEKILSLNPTHVLAQKEGVDRYSKQLIAAGVQLAAFPAKRLEDYRIMVTELGRLTEKNQKAIKLTLSFRENFSSIPLPFRPVTFLLGVETQSQIFMGQGSFLSEVFKRCGGENLVEKSGYPKLGRETLASLKPEKVFLLEHNAKKASLKRLSKLVSVDERKIIVLDPNLYSRLTHGLSKNAKSLCKKVINE